jgi:hypothetical protein
LFENSSFFCEKKDLSRTFSAETGRSQKLERGGGYEPLGFSGKKKIFNLIVFLFSFSGTGTH